jgi:hypothetical protein
MELFQHSYKINPSFFERDKTSFKDRLSNFPIGVKIVAIIGTNKGMNKIS